MEFPRGYIQERVRSREHENERKAFAFLKEFFKSILVYTISGTNYILFGKTRPAGTDPYQFNGSVQVSTTSSSAAPYLNLVRARGTEASPLPLSSGDTIGYMAGTGAYNTTSYYAGGTVEFVASENWSSTNRGTGIIFKTTPNGSASLQESGKILPSGELVGGGTCFYVPDSGGVPAFTPEVVPGKVPLVVDDAGGIAYIYTGGAWVALN